jgi:hypothetical protein
MWLLGGLEPVVERGRRWSRRWVGIGLRKRFVLQCVVVRLWLDELLLRRDLRIRRGYELGVGVLLERRVILLFGCKFGLGCIVQLGHQLRLWVELRVG